MEEVRQEEIPNSVENEVKTDNLKKSAVSSIGKWVQIIFLLVLVIALLTISLMAKDGFDNRMDIVKSDNISCDTQYCLKATATYKNGTLSWDAINGMPALGFSISTSKVYPENQQVVLTCPISYDGTQNVLYTKVMFIFGGKDIGKCK